MTAFDESWKRFIEANAPLLGVEIRREHTERFALHGEDLLRWNRKINLTAITDPREMAIKHFLDSMVPARFIAPDATLLDIGSGGGFPGLVLGAMMPSLKITLIDASLKKVNFLKHAARTLGLENIRALHIRAEDLARPDEFFQVVISRALTDLKKFIRMATPLVARDGLIMAMAGPGSGEGGIAESIRDTAGNVAWEMYSYTLPEIHHARKLHLFRSISSAR